MNFYEEWDNRLSDTAYIIEYLSKSDNSRSVLRSGTEAEVKFACDVLRKIRIETFIEALKYLDMERIPNTEEIPQCGTLEKAICEVPQALAFEPEGLICQDLGLKIGAENHGDAPRKSGEGNGKLADAMDIAIRMKLSVKNGKTSKYGYKLSTLGKYLLRFENLDEKVDVISRLLIREYVVQKLFVGALNGYAGYNDVVSSLASEKTRMRRRQNVRRMINIVASEITETQQYIENIDWEVKGNN